MNLSCVICAELFKPSDDVHITPCGHMFHYICILQWFERSKTCPQCRNKCLPGSIKRVYFNLANVDNSRLDIGTLQQQVDDEILKTKNIQLQLSKVSQHNEELKSVQKRCMRTIGGLENELKHSKILIDVKDSQISLLNTNVKVIDEQRKQIQSLTEKLDLMNSVESVISSTTLDVEHILKNESTRESLAIWVVTLKRELRASELKKSDLRNILKGMQNDGRNKTKTIKTLNDKILHYDSEIYSLKTKLQELEDEKGNSLEAGAQKQSPCNCATKKSNITAALQGIVSPLSHRVKLIEESTSPYLNIQSSSIGLSHLMRSNVDKKRSHVNALKSLQTTVASEARAGSSSSESAQNGVVKKANTEVSQKYSIFKKPRLTTTTSNFIHAGMRKSQVKDAFGY